MNRVQWFLLAAASAFGVAALVHGGVLEAGYQHREAAIAESVIAVVLALALAATGVAPHLTRPLGLAAQGFALFGTMVGIVMIAIGVGPQSAFDIVLHAGFVTLLITGLASTARRPVV